MDNLWFLILVVPLIKPLQNLVAAFRIWFLNKFMYRPAFIVGAIFDFATANFSGWNFGPCVLVRKDKLKCYFYDLHPDRHGGIFPILKKDLLLCSMSFCDMATPEAVDQLLAKHKEQVRPSEDAFDKFSFSVGDK